MWMQSGSVASSDRLVYEPKKGDFTGRPGHHGGRGATYRGLAGTNFGYIAMLEW